MIGYTKYINHNEARFISIFAFLPTGALFWLIKQNQDYY